MKDKNENNIIINDKPKISESLKKYYLAQAYVYEDLINSKLFDQIDWKNKVNNDEEGEEISLLNQNKYKIKKTEFLYDIIITNNKNKNINIIVQVLNEKKDNLIKLKCDINQWKLFNNEEKEQNMYIFALVKFGINYTPEIYYVKKSHLNELFN